jgi:hypothetical protein
MSVVRISSQQFEAHGIARGPILAPVTETSWFADDEKDLIGTVFLDLSDNDWNWVVLGKAEGGYRYVAGNGSLPTQQQAEQALINEIERR